MKNYSLRTGSILLVLATAMALVGCDTPAPARRGEANRPRSARQASKYYVLAGNWSPINGDGNQITFVPDVGGPSTGHVIGIFSDAGTYQASEITPETGRFSMWVNAGRIDADDPLSRTSFSGEFSADGKMLSLTRHWGGGLPDESKTYRR